MSLSIIEQAWLSHVDLPCMMGIGKPPTQFHVTTQEQFLALIYNNIDKDIYVSVHSTETRRNKIFNKVYFDIDMLKADEDLQGAFEDAYEFHLWLVLKNYSHRVYFTGKKGFAFYIDFDPVVIDDYSDRIEALIDHFRVQLKLKRFDIGVCKDVNRISRLPYTKHTGSGNFCQPINLTKVKFFDLTHFLASNKPINIKRDAYLIDKIGFITGYLKFEYEKMAFIKPKKPASSDIETTLTFILENGASIPEGARHNAVWKIVIPSMVMLDYAYHEIASTCKTFMIEILGKADIQWIQAQIRSATKKEIIPMGLQRFRHEYNWR